MRNPRCAARRRTDVTVVQWEWRRRKKKRRGKGCYSYFSLGKDARNTGCVSFWPEDGITFLRRFSFFPNCITHPMKKSAFENILLRFLSRLLHRYLGLKPERGRKKKSEKQKLFFQLKGKTDWKGWMLPTKSGSLLHHVCYESSVWKRWFETEQSKQGLSHKLSHVQCFHGVTIPISSPSLQKQDGAYATSAVTKVRMNRFLLCLCSNNHHCEVPNWHFASLWCWLLFVYHPLPGVTCSPSSSQNLSQAVSSSYSINKYKTGNCAYFFLLRTDKTWQSDPILKLQYRLLHIW